MAQQHPEAIQALILSLPAGGTTHSSAIRYDINQSYLRYIQPVETHGMAGVWKVKNSYYSKLLETRENPEVFRSKLLAIDPAVFLQAMRTSSEHEMWTEREPFVGITRAELTDIKLPALVMHSGDLKDTCHTLSDAKQVSSISYLALTRSYLFVYRICIII